AGMPADDGTRVEEEDGLAVFSSGHLECRMSRGERVVTTAELEARARNDRYLDEFVEAFRLCPYARPCRESGKLHRRVLRSRDEALPAIREIEALPEQDVEVALLIFPSEPASGEPSAR